MEKKKKSKYCIYCHHLLPKGKGQGTRIHCKRSKCEDQFHRRRLRLQRKSKLKYQENLRLSEARLRYKEKKKNGSLG